MRHPTRMIPALMILGFLIQSPSALAQSLLERFGRSIEGSIQRGSPPNITLNPFPNMPSQPQDNRPRSQGFGIPGESGRENNPGGFFRPDNGFFQPQPGTPPRQIVQPQPTPIERSQPYPQPTFPNQPRQVYPTQPVPQFSPVPSGNTQPRIIRQEGIVGPPVRQAAVSGLPLSIRCPKTLGRSVSYQIISDKSSYPFSMSPGQIQRLTESRIWRIRYPSGGRQVVYRLRGGKTYEFDTDGNGNLQLYEDDQTVAEPPKRSSVTSG